MSVMEASDILNVIPHRYPFMLVDRILEFDKENNRIVGLKNLTFNELFSLWNEATPLGSDLFQAAVYAAPSSRVFSASISTPPPVQPISDSNHKPASRSDPAPDEKLITLPKPCALK